MSRLFSNFSYFSTTVVIKACEPIFTLFLSNCILRYSQLTAANDGGSNKSEAAAAAAAAAGPFKQGFCGKRVWSVFLIVGGACSFSASDATLQATGTYLPTERFTVL